MSRSIERSHLWGGDGAVGNIYSPEKMEMLYLSVQDL